MSDIIEWTEDHLTYADYDVRRDNVNGQTVLSFENDAVFGFVLSFNSAHDMLTNWGSRAEGILARNTLVIRRAEVKAWSVYLVLLASGSPGSGEQYAVSDIEENLVGTRKIARANVTSFDRCREAILPLLPLPKAPGLEPIDFEAELKKRSTSIPSLLLSELFKTVSRGDGT